MKTFAKSRPGTTFGDACERALEYMFDYKGKASSSEYIWFYAAAFIYFSVVSIILSILSWATTGAGLGGLYSLFLQPGLLVLLFLPIIPLSSLLIRRLRDAGLPIFLAIIAFIPFINVFWLILVGFWPRRL